MGIEIYTDGGARGNPGSAAAGVVIVTEKTEYQSGYYLGERTNNQAEYLALILALEQLNQLEDAKQINHQDLTTLNVYLDSELVVKQLNHEYKVKDPDLQKLNQQVQALAKAFSMIKFKHIPREENRRADAIVNQVLDLQIGL
ncbi:MAG TPA: ribonuclease HI family protein [Candidatus Saccharimonadales bacterium]